MAASGPPAGEWGLPRQVDSRQWRRPTADRHWRPPAADRLYAQAALVATEEWETLHGTDSDGAETSTGIIPPSDVITPGAALVSATHPGRIEP